MSCSTGNVSSPPQRTKQVGFVGGYVHSVPRLLHLRQCGISFPHLRFAVAQASHAFVSRVVAMFVGGGFHSLWRKIDQLLARLLRLDYSDCICKYPVLGGSYRLWDSHRPPPLNLSFPARSQLHLAAAHIFQRRVEFQVNIAFVRDLVLLRISIKS